MDAARDRLAAQMNERRVDLRLRWSEVASRASLDPSYLRRIRKGEVPISDLAARQIEDALEWEPGSVAAILAGGEPAPRAAPEPADPARILLIEAYDLWRADGLSHDEALAKIDAEIERINQRRRNRANRQEKSPGRVVRSAPNG